MRRTIPWVVLLQLLSACSPHAGSQATRTPLRLISTSWTTVRALAAGTDVGVALDRDEVRYGRINAVGEFSLTLWERHGAAVIPRDRVARLSIRHSLGTTRARHVASGAIAGALIGAVAGSLAMAEENTSSGGAKGVMLLLGTGLGAAIASQRAPSERFHDEVIYIRP